MNSTPKRPRRCTAAYSPLELRLGSYFMPRPVPHLPPAARRPLPRPSPPTADLLRRRCRRAILPGATRWLGASPEGQSRSTWRRRHKTRARRQFKASATSAVANPRWTVHNPDLQGGALEIRVEEAISRGRSRASGRCSATPSSSITSCRRAPGVGSDADKRCGGGSDLDADEERATKAIAARRGAVGESAARRPAFAEDRGPKRRRRRSHRREVAD